MTQYLLACLAVLWWSVALCAAPAVTDVATNLTNGSSFTTLTVSGVDISGTGRGLGGCIVEQTDGTSISSVVLDPTGVNLPFNLIISHISGGWGPGIWYLRDAPVISNADVVITFTGSDDNLVMATMIAFDGVKTSADPTLTNEHTCASCTTVSMPLTTTVDNSMVMTCTRHTVAPNSFTHGTDQIERSDFGSGSVAPADWSTSSTELRATAGSDTFTDIAASTGNMNGLVIAIEPFPEEGPPVLTRRRILPFR